MPTAILKLLHIPPAEPLTHGRVLLGNLPHHVAAWLELISPRAATELTSRLSSANVATRPVMPMVPFRRCELPALIVAEATRPKPVSGTLMSRTTFTTRPDRSRSTASELITPDLAPSTRRRHAIPTGRLTWCIHVSAELVERRSTKATDHDIFLIHPLQPARTSPSLPAIRAAAVHAIRWAIFVLRTTVSVSARTRGRGLILTITRPTAAALSLLLRWLFIAIDDNDPTFDTFFSSPGRANLREAGECRVGEHEK
ncbi:MAG: hypothetical protein JNK25_13490 [Phycisphaerae bacterium]|nr:hypothetical protein [Phycisphaerae bacterium]